MRVLVTGACGFIGSHLVEHFAAEGHEVVALDRLDETASLGWLRGVATPVWHDLRAQIGDGLGLAELAKPFDWICHLAAASDVTRSVRDPLAFVSDNVVGTAHVLEYARRVRPRKLLYFSTDEVFGPAAEGQLFDPVDRFHATNPYAASKAAAEALMPTWASTYGLPIVVTHCTNVYGPRQHHEKLIPLVIKALRSETTIQVHVVDGREASRRWVHVSDVCRAVSAVLSRGGVIAGRSSGRYNIAGDEEHCVGAVVEQIGKILKIQPITELVENPPGRPRPDSRYDVNDWTTRKLGWEPAVPFLRGLEETVQWYLDHGY